MTKYDWNKEALNIILGYNFVKAKDFSIEEIKEVFDIKDNILKESAQTDFEKYIQAQNILVKLAKAYEKEIKELFTNKNSSLNMNFNIDGIKFKIYDASLNNDKISYTANPKNKEVIIYTELPKLLQSDSISACLHEIIHCLDYNDLKDKKAITKSANLSGIDYLTSPLEYNAITNELFLKAVNIICKYAWLNKTEPKELIKDKKLLAKILSRMLTDMCENDNTYKNFLTCQSEDKLRHIFNRLYGFVEKALKENCIKFLDKLTNLRLELLFESILLENK